MKNGMEELKTVKVDKKKMSVMNDLLSEKINDVLSDE